MIYKFVRPAKLKFLMNKKLSQFNTLFSILLTLFSFFWSLFLAQVNVYDTATQQQRDTHPGQDETVAKASWGQLFGGRKNFLIM